MESVTVKRSFAVLIADNGTTVGRSLGILDSLCPTLGSEHGILVEISFHLPDEDDNKDA